MDARHEALVSLGRELQARHYRFTTITPATNGSIADPIPRSTSSAVSLDGAGLLDRRICRPISLPYLNKLACSVANLQVCKAYGGPSCYRWRKSGSGWQMSSVMSLILPECPHHRLSLSKFDQ
jgi:hypothetical protein